MKDLIEINKSQQLRAIPEIPDVQRLRLKRNKIYTFEATVIKTNITSSTTVDVGVALTFALNDLFNVSEFTALFDQYRIAQVNVKFMIESTPAYNNVGAIYSVLDYDDSSTLNLNQIVQYDTLMVCPMSGYFERTLNPRIATAAYSGAFTSFANMSSRTWIDVASPSVQYFGVKLTIPTTATASVIITPVCTYLVQTRASR